MSTISISAQEPVSVVPPQNTPHFGIERDLNTKLVPSSKKLLEELRKAVGPDQYYSVEMRHNVYKIKASTDFDLERLIKNCGLFTPSSPYLVV